MSETVFLLLSKSDFRSVVRTASKGHTAPVVIQLHLPATLTNPANVEWSWSHEIMLSDTKCYAVFLMWFRENCQMVCLRLELENLWAL